MKHFTRRTIGSLLAATVFVALQGAASAQTIQTNLYGNIDYGVSKADGRTADTFAVPTVDFFFRGQAGKLSVLSEMVFDVPDGNSFQVDIDRLMLSYEFSEAFKLSAGRFHLALGYFNTAYPHGAAIYLLSVDRPATVSQYEQEALLPALGVGLQLSGRIHAGREAFTYDLEILNGRGTDASEVVDATDHNKSKAVNVRLRYEPSFLDGLIVGGNVYVDRIPPVPLDPVSMMSPQPLSFGEQIFGAHIAYMEYPWHFIGEFFDIRHHGGGQTFTTLAGFGEVGYSIGSVTPYVREELAKFPTALDPYYALTGQQSRGNFEATSAGVKWAVYDYLALKLELEWNHAEVDSEYSAVTQAAFGF